MKYTVIGNNQCIPLRSIPILKYDDFLDLNTSLVQIKENHCVNYYGFQHNGSIKLICCIANDKDHHIYISSYEVRNEDFPLLSFTAHQMVFQAFEREIHENFGLPYSDHPWLKPIRYSYNRNAPSNTMDNYPFYNVRSDEIHEVGVGPIHAGIIEPGHFRFICDGEQILHLEIQLGYQHRGIEALFLEKKSLSQRILLSESIAGDTVAGHASAFANVWESLCDYSTTEELIFTRNLALEIERIAVHTGDLSAICADIGYQLGSAVFGRLRTPIINFMQEWCGNRLSKGLIRPGTNHYPITPALADSLRFLLEDYEKDFLEMYAEMKVLPTVIARLEKTGTLSKEHVESIGAVGMAAKASGMARDIRRSHPYGSFTQLLHEPVIKHHGDVYSRTQIRKAEIIQSMEYIRYWLKDIPGQLSKEEILSPMPDSFALSLVEGWRGEICHCAISDKKGELLHYKIKDPSMHNWLALALAVRNNEISDFPICNKSFNLSYCGHDL